MRIEFRLQNLWFLRCKRLFHVLPVFPQSGLQQDSQHRSLNCRHNMLVLYNKGKKTPFVLHLSSSLQHSETVAQVVGVRPVTGGLPLILSVSCGYNVAYHCQRVNVCMNGWMTDCRVK
ncbi:hypothetical protein GOODEAATRI_017423 [Goodea atripinnis]|uniref:Uncharacterized protein n=1 Tax=Goodea atripinnis TaxID=208336 RepID=A0ABV0P5M0_9TELE